MAKKPESPEAKPERMIVNMPPDLVAKIEAYRRAAPGSIPTKSDAVRELIEAGVAAKLGKGK